MANHYSKSILYTYPISIFYKSLMSSYNNLYLCGAEQSTSIVNKPQISFKFIENPPVYFATPLSEDSADYQENIRWYKKFTSKLVDCYPQSNLQQVFNSYDKIFLQAIRYGLEFTLNFEELTENLHQLSNYQKISTELINVACATVECASYFAAATRNEDYFSNKTIGALETINMLYTSRLQLGAYKQDYYNYTQHNFNQDDFILHYENISGSDFSLSLLKDFTLLREKTKLENSFDLLNNDNQPIQTKQYLS